MCDRYLRRPDCIDGLRPQRNHEHSGYSELTLSGKAFTERIRRYASGAPGRRTYPGYGGVSIQACRLLRCLSLHRRNRELLSV